MTKPVSLKDKDEISKYQIRDIKQGLLKDKVVPSDLSTGIGHITVVHLNICGLPYT